MRFTLFIVIATLLIGCARTKAPSAPVRTPSSNTQVNPTSSELKAAARLKNEKIDNALNNSQSCTNNLNESELGKNVANDVLVLSKSQKNALNLLKSQSKLNTSQKNKLVNYLNANIKCRDILLSELEGTSLLPVQEKSNLVLDRVYGALISGEVSIGDGNLLLFHMTEASNNKFNSARSEFRLQQIDQYTAAQNEEKQKELSNKRTNTNNSSAASAAALSIACSFSKDPQACIAGALSGLTNETDRTPKTKGFSASDQINEDIKKRQIIEDAKRQMQMDLDSEKRRKDLLDYKTKSRNY